MFGTTSSYHISKDGLETINSIIHSLAFTLMASSTSDTSVTYEWRRGDPNDQTSTEYDRNWVIWVLRQKFPAAIAQEIIPAYWFFVTNSDNPQVRLGSWWFPDDIPQPNQEANNW
jgi:hypothetical protein